MMKLNLTGVKPLNRKLDSLKVEANAITKQMVSGLAADTQRIAIRDIKSAPKSGRVYTTYFYTNAAGKAIPYGSRPPHQASAPFEPPADDTGLLAANINITSNNFGFTARVGTPLVYGRYLEFGTSKMRPRPWLVPALREAKDEGRYRFGRLVKNMIRSLRFRR